MLLKTLELGPFLTNCYIVGSNATREGMILDPAAEADTILSYVRQMGLKIKIVVLTHAHPDHTMALNSVMEETGATFAAHEAEPVGRGLDEVSQMISMMAGGPIDSPPKPQIRLKDGDVIDVGDLSFTVLHTPGHSPGGISLYGHGVVFVGDTLFNFSIGRTDFPGCSHRQLINSIKSKLMNLPEDTVVYPGHGPKTTIRNERQYNPFLVA